MLFLAYPLLLVLSLAGTTAPGEEVRGGNVAINIHVRLQEDAEAEGVELNLLAQSLAPNNQIHFAGAWVPLQRPHVTLYLTEFPAGNVAAVEAAVGAAVAGGAGESCIIPLTSAPQASGDYILWPTGLPECLQTLSDAIVLATSSLASPHQPIPPWVEQLPEGPRRARLVSNVEKFGSPTVFGDYSPHVTLAWDGDEPLGPVAKEMAGLAAPVGSAIEVVALGSVGLHGSVLRGKDMAVFVVPEGQPG